MNAGEIRVGSLFSGYGGLDAAVLAILGESARIVWHSDIKPAAVRLLEVRDPGVPNLGDIHGIDADMAAPVDALVFGWPCQPHSSAGKRLGQDDPRALWPEVARIIAALRPRYLFGENVARVTSNGELARVTRTLAQLGYLGTYRTLRASDVKAPHRRDRLFLYAVDATAADAESGQLRLEPGRGSGQDGQGAGVAGDNGAHGQVGLTLLPTPCARLGGSRGFPNPGTAAARRARGTRDLEDSIALLPTPGARDHKGVMPRGARKDGYARTAAQLCLPGAVALLPTPAVADARNTRNATAGRSAEQEHHHSGWTLCDVAHADRWGEYSAAIARWEHVMGREAPEPTVPNRNGNPALSPRFVEWMMGLPLDWVNLPELSRSQQLSLLGDGVVPHQGIAAYRELVARLVSRETQAAEVAS